MQSTAHFRDVDRNPAVPDVRRHPAGLRERLSRRVVVLEQTVNARFEVARITLTRPHVALIRRVWQLVSVSTQDHPGGQVTDPAYLSILETEHRATVQWNLAWREEDDRGNASFPQDVQNLADAPSLGEQPEGWINTPLMYPWGQASTQRIRIAENASLSLYCDVTQTDGSLTAIGGLLEGESRLAQDIPEFWQWWGRQ